jgi:diguanylate cyclase (GGDEF)-like protein
VSFQGRLLLFFALIVVVPMIVVGALVVSLTEDSRTGKADAALASALQTALSLNQETGKDSLRGAREAAKDQQLADALRDDKVDRALLERLGRRYDLAYLGVERNGDITDTGNGPPVGGSNLQLNGLGGGTEASIEASSATADEYAKRLGTLTGDGVAVVSGDKIVQSSLPDGELTIPDSGETSEAELDNGTVRLASAALPNTDGLRVALSTPVDEETFLGKSPLVAAALAGFFLLALALVFLVMSSMRSQVRSMLSAARRIGDGDFSQTVPVVGNDELAGLASEFNKMSGRLEQQIAELRRQRLEIDRSLQRLGEAIAAGLDREALVEIVVETALGACDADFGRVALSDRTVVPKGGRPGAAAREAIRAAELGARAGISSGSHEKAHAIAAPLVRIGTDQALGVISVAREGEEFGRNERDVLLYLAGQASASISNIAEQQEVGEQAVTDELTGLSNRRAFAEWMEVELERARRFNHSLSLVMIDLDDFKQVNDTFGHLNGDEVLRAVGRVLRSQSREIDSAARYGGEEFAVALPETGPEGAHEQAERIRELIEAESIDLGDGKTLHVTASFGTATSPGVAGSVRELIAGADSALYTAKRNGKNRVVTATEPVELGPELNPAFE